MDTPAVNVAAPEACHSCGGAGTVNDARCTRCEGTGKTALVGGYDVSWGDALLPDRMREERARSTAQSLVRGAACVFGFIGLVAFVATGIVSVKNGGSLYEILFAFGWAPLLFWIGALADLFIFVELERELQLHIPIPRRIYEGREGEHATPPWLSIWSTMTPAAKRALARAEAQAQSHARPCTGVDLFLMTLIDEGVDLMLARLGVARERLLTALTRAVQSHELMTTGDLGAIVLSAYTAAYQDRQTVLDVPYLFMAAAMIDPLVRESLFALNIDQSKIQNVLLWLQHDERRRNAWRRFSARARLRPRNRLDRAMSALATPIIDHFAVDYTERAQWGEFQSAVSRPEITDAVLKILDSGHSVILVGLPGVGKMGILQDLAQRMVADDVPAILQDKRLLSVSIPKLVSGATAAEAEERLMQLFREAARSRNIIFVFEEVQGMMGITSGGEASVDLGGTLASLMERTSQLCLATATPDAYRQHIAPSPLGQLVERVALPEPSTDEAIRIVESRVGHMEWRYRVAFSYDAIATLVELTVRYIHDRYLPKKALAYLDELALSVRERYGVNHVITAGDVESFLSAKLNIPVARAGAEESETLLALEDRLHERVVDQEQAVSAVANALRRARAEIRDRRRPVASFLFLGPTGVGKTELAKAVAAVYFGSVEHMVRLDMTEYQELSSLSRLIGTPIARGVLTEAIRTSPFALVLLDEIEKAHRDVINVFLQVMDDARLTDGRGETIDCSNIILIATSNAAASFIQDELAKGTSPADIERALMERELKTYFHPEFLNRFDGVMVFRPLTMEHVEMIAGRMLDEVGERLKKEHGVVFTADTSAIKKIARDGFDPLFGARPLRRLVQDRIDAPLAKLLLSGELFRRDTIRVGADLELHITKATRL